MLVICLILLIINSTHGSGVCECNNDQFRGRYICLCENFTVINQVDSFEVIHEDGFDNSLVSDLQFFNSNITFNSPILWETFPNTHSFVLWNVGVKKLLSFEKCSQLEDIILYKNDISALESGIFDSCKNLNELNVAANKIRLIDDFALKYLENLQLLDLSYNFLSSITQEMFSTLRSLRELHLTQNQLKNIEGGTFRNLTRLEKLFISGNELIEIQPTALHGLKSLTILDAGNNNLKKIHPEFFRDLSNLEELYLNDNWITALVETSFTATPNLNTIDLDRNRINSTDPQFFNGLSTSLRYLYLSSNICIDKHFILINDFQSEVLPELEWCIDNFASIPDNSIYCQFYNHSEFGYTCELNGVNLGDQNDSFPVTGNHLSGMNDDNVETIIFTNSTISRIPEEIPQKFSFLERLVAKNVNFQRLDEKTLTICGTLKFIDLSENKIVVISDKAFETCSNLTSIDLSYNKISSLPARIFSNNKNLESINLDHNLISKIEPCNNAIQQLKQLKILSLKWNICVSNSFRHQNLHLLFKQIVLKDLKVCYGFWFL